MQNNLITKNEDLDTYLAYFYSTNDINHFALKLNLKKETIPNPTIGMDYSPLGDTTVYSLLRVYPGYTITEDLGSLVKESKYRTVLIFYKKEKKNGQ